MNVHKDNRTWLFDVKFSMVSLASLGNVMLASLPWKQGMKSLDPDAKGGFGIRLRDRPSA